MQMYRVVAQTKKRELHTTAPWSIVERFYLLLYSITLRSVLLSPLKLYSYRQTHYTYWYIYELSILPVHDL